MSGQMSSVTRVLKASNINLNQKLKRLFNTKENNKQKKKKNRGWNYFEERFKILMEPKNLNILSELISQIYSRTELEITPKMIAHHLSFSEIVLF